MDEDVIKRAMLTKYRKYGAILDEVKCQTAHDVYWKSSPEWVAGSPEWRSCFARAAMLASGLRLFEGGFYTHPCGDPATIGQLRDMVREFRFYRLEGESPDRPGAEAVRMYWRNIRRNAKGLTVYYGGRLDPIEEGLRGVEYAAEIFGIELETEAAA